MRFSRPERLGLICILGWMVFAGAACIDYQETIRVKHNGKVEITVYATVVKAAMPMVKNRPELRQLILLPEEAGAARRLFPENVEIVHWVIEDGPGIRVIDVKIRVASMEALQQNIGLITSSENFKLYRDNNGNYRYEREVPAYPIGSELGMARNMLEARLRNSNLAFTLIVPTGIISSNSKQISSQKVQWQTDLVGLRNQGFAMHATIAPPPIVSPWTYAGTGVLLLGLMLLPLLYRIRPSENYNFR